MMSITFLDMRDASATQRDSAARILMSALAHLPSAWHDMENALAEVTTFLDDPERLAVLALRADDVVGWIGAIRQSEFAWELHPLVVDPAAQRNGLGTQLVRHLESLARSEGVITMWLGTDDDFGGTNLYGSNLYPDVLNKLMALRETSGHPYRFYEKLGYTVTGVFPDVDGLGKHDILMARRIV